MTSNGISCFNFILGADVTGIVLAAILALVVGAVASWLVYRFYVRKNVGSVKQECDKMRETAQVEAKEFLKEAKLEAREEQQRLRSEVDKEIREKRAEVARNEQRVNQRDEQLGKREFFKDYYTAY